MKKQIAILLLAALLVGSMVVVSGATPLRVALLVNGTLGDRSFFDSAASGVVRAEKELGIQARIIEMSYDPSSWEPTLADVADQDWDIIIVGTWQMTEYLEEIASWHPDKRFFIFDTSVDYSLGLENVYSILYKQNEGSFLAGALAAMVTTSDLPYANPNSKVVGFLGGMDIPVINDFLVGYIEGVLYVEPAARVAISYIGSFDDSARGKEMALAQYNRGADIGFNVAGQAGLGQLDAAKDVNRYAIGVDADQALLFRETDPAKANLIITSMMKQVGESLFRGIKMHMEGTLEYGKAESLGIAEGAIALAENEFFERIATPAMREAIKELAELVVAGEITVSSAFGMSTQQLNALRDSVRP